MKEITKMSRLNGQLEKMFRLINHDWFNDELPEAIITAVPTAKAYAHYTPWDAWQTGTGAKREINISTAYLDRPLENIVASLIHEMVHMYNDCITHEQDTSRGGTYHNKHFKAAAEAHGLICHKSDKYGYSDTSSELSDILLDWVLANEIPEIQLYRDEFYGLRVATGAKAGNANTTQATPKAKSHSRKYTCPCCGNSARATKQINLVCGDCMVAMVES